MRFSVFTVSLPEWTPEEAVEHLAALGYDGIEWRVVDQPAADGPPGFWSGNRCTLPLRTLAVDAPRVRALADRAGLAVPNLGTYVSCLDTDAVEPRARRRGRNGCAGHPRPSPELRRAGAIPAVA